MIVYGLNPVLEALRAGRAAALEVSRREDTRLAAVLRLAAEKGVAIRRVEAAELDRVTRGGVHQGVLAVVDAGVEHSVRDLVKAASGAPLLVVLDGIEDPQNLGAILRVADAAGADGVVRQARHAAPLGASAAKASAGALAHVKIATVVNVARAVEELKDLRVWAVGLSADAPRSCYEMDFTEPTAVVLGAEGTGLRRLVRERCDWLARIPMVGHVGSLNVAAAAAVVLFEARRQRQSASGRSGGA